VKTSRAHKRHSSGNTAEELRQLPLADLVLNKTGRKMCG
jgi:hypothetical protein